MSEVPTDRLREDAVRRYLLLDSANVADVLDERGLRNQCLAAEFRPVAGSRVAGFAFTLTGTTNVAGIQKDAFKMEACSKVSSHEVTVWSGGGGNGAFLGELIAVGLRERGCVGAIVEGGVRDRRWLDPMGFPIFATEVTPTQSAGRCRVTGYGEPILLAGAAERTVSVSPGDFVLGDEDGVVIVPAHLVHDVLIEVEQLTRHEETIRKELSRGLSLRECLELHGKV